ncbi:hypothetical protein EIP91_009141 [Steccherinum ochraceum]|uniref:Uncharacterized protein n=1 Tax=Steccherinum ochraceum TaxID=92696 RepID=A0A4V2MV44_9APHY|nr:hypothetical protein EIP91_009141 [Steccherinum ochraceum]
MPSKNAAFYAYIKHATGDVVYVGVFANRMVANLWWRAIMVSANVQLQKSIKRITAQFYSQAAIGDVEATLQDPQCAAHLKNQVFFVMANGVGSVSPGLVPPDDGRDAVNKEIYLIRASGDPTMHWAVSSTGTIVCSRTDMTFFRLYAKVPNLPGVNYNDGVPFIGDDEITLQIVDTDAYLKMDAPDGNKLSKLSVAPQSSVPSKFKFKYFEGKSDLHGFGVEKGVGGDDAPHVVCTFPDGPVGQGIAWELV